MRTTWAQRFLWWLRRQPAPVRWLATGTLLEQYLSWEVLVACVMGASTFPYSIISTKDGQAHFAAGILFIVLFPAALLWAIFFGTLIVKELIKKW
jgi:hypothetical protein